LQLGHVNSMARSVIFFRIYDAREGNRFFTFRLFRSKRQDGMGQQGDHRMSGSNSPAPIVLTDAEFPRIAVLDWGDGWIAVDKPCHLSVHNQTGTDLCSLVARHLANTPSTAAEVRFEAEFGVHAIHRLDKLTSGVMLLACRAEAFRRFARLFETRAVEKRYLAVVHGHVTCPAGSDEQWGIWDWPLCQVAAGRRHPAGKPPLSDSVTRYRVLRYSRHYSLLVCEPLTGRTHQIRRHARLAGHAVVGDARYGTPRSVTFLRNRVGFERLGLHAWSLKIQIPEQKEPKLIRAVEFPSEMRQLVENDLKPEDPWASDMVP
jgi:23S rRNA pseudouridine1911/1915/1917 synthase